MFLFHRCSLLICLMFSWVLWQGCAGDLKPKQELPSSDAGATSDEPPQDGPPKTRTIPGQKIVTKSLGNGVNQVTVNASDSEVWIYYSFSFQRQIKTKEPENSNDWDLGFQRFQIKSNGGISGKGGVVVTFIDDRPFDSIRHAPGTPFVSDKEDGDDEDTEPDFAFLVKGKWYVYNPIEHTLKPRNRVYIVKGVEGQYYKVKFLNYYDKDGNSGFPTFKWAKVLPPKAVLPPGPKVQTKDLGDGVTQVRINAAENSKWIYFSFATNAEAKVEIPEDSTEWAIGFQRFQIKSNGGVNGKRGVMVAHADDEDFDAVKTAPKSGYVSDKPDGDDADEEPDWGFHVSGAWFQYDPKSHTLQPRKRIYFVKVNETYYKMQILSYYEGKVSGLPTFKWAKVAPPQ